MYFYTHTHNTFLQQIKCKQSGCSVSLPRMLLHHAPRPSRSPFIALFRTSLNIYPPLCSIPALSNNRLGVFLFASFRSSTFCTETKEAVMRYISAEWLMNKWWFLKWIPLRFPSECLAESCVEDANLRLREAPPSLLYDKWVNADKLRLHRFAVEKLVVIWSRHCWARAGWLSYLTLLSVVSQR